MSSVSTRDLVSFCRTQFDIPTIKGGMPPELIEVFENQPYLESEQPLGVPRIIDHQTGMMIGGFDPELTAILGQMSIDALKALSEVLREHSEITLRGCLSSVSVTPLTTIVKTDARMVKLFLEENYFTEEDCSLILASVVESKTLQSFFFTTIGPYIPLSDEIKDHLSMNKIIAHHNRCRRVMTLQMCCLRAMGTSQANEVFCYSRRTGLEGVDLGADPGFIHRCQTRNLPMYYKTMQDFINRVEFEEDEIVPQFF